MQLTLESSNRDPADSDPAAIVGGENRDMMQTLVPRGVRGRKTSRGQGPPAGQQQSQARALLHSGLCMEQLASSTNILTFPADDGETEAWGG